MGGGKGGPWAWPAWDESLNALTVCRQASGLPMCLVFKVPPGRLVSYAPHPGHLSTCCVPAISLAPKSTAPEPNLARFMMWMIHTKTS